jgi:hypothetical protein
MWMEDILAQVLKINSTRPHTVSSDLEDGRWTELNWVPVYLSNMYGADARINSEYGNNGATSLTINPT